MQKYRPCERATGQAEWEPSRGHVESTLYLHRTKFKGVGRVSEAVLSRKDSCSDGKSLQVSFHTSLSPFWLQFVMVYRRIECFAHLLEEYMYV